MAAEGRFKIQHVLGRVAVPRPLGIGGQANFDKPTKVVAMLCLAGAAAKDKSSHFNGRARSGGDAEVDQKR